MLGSQIEENLNFSSLEPLLNEKLKNFAPFLLSSGKKEAALDLKGIDEVEIFFIYISGMKDERELLRYLVDNKENISIQFFQELAGIIYFSSNETLKKEITSFLEIITETQRTPFVRFILSISSKELQKIPETGFFEDNAALFLESLKALKYGKEDDGFLALLSIFEKAGFPQFIYRLLSFFVMKLNNLSPDIVHLFVEKVTSIPGYSSFTQLKFMEFLFYHKRKEEDKIAKCVIELAEGTNSLFVLNTLLPFLYQYKKWQLLAKYYKLSSKAQAGKDKIRYLEILADIYEHKLGMADFATDIYKTIVEIDSEASSSSMSRVVAAYEDNEQWEELVSLYGFLAEKENDQKIKAYYLYKSGTILFREMRKIKDARKIFEQSLEYHVSFEILRELTEIYQKEHNFQGMIRLLNIEFNITTDSGRKISILEKISDVYSEYMRDLENAALVLEKALEIDSERITTLKKLGKICYYQKNWKRLAEINSKEIAITENMHEVVNLLYKNGLIYFKELKDYETSLTYFIEVVNLEKGHIPSMLYLEKIYILKKDPEKLIDIYQQLVEFSSNNSGLKEYYLTRLAIMYRENEKLEEAINSKVYFISFLGTHLPKKI